MYFVVRITLFLIAVTIPTVQTFAAFSGMLLLFPVALVAVVQPYKVPLYNSIDVLLLLTLSLFSFTAVAHLLEKGNAIFMPYTIEHLIPAMLCIFGIIPLVYITIIVLYRVLYIHILHPWLSVLWCRVLHCLKQSNSSDEPEALPERLSNPLECEALFQEPVSPLQDAHYGSIDTIHYQ